MTSTKTRIRSAWYVGSLNTGSRGKCVRNDWIEVDLFYFKANFLAIKLSLDLVHNSIYSIGWIEYKKSNIFRAKIKINRKATTNKKSFLFVRYIADAPHVHLIDESLNHFIWKSLSLDLDATFISVVDGFGFILLYEHENDTDLLARAKGDKEEELFAEFGERWVFFFGFLLDLVLFAVFVGFELFGLDCFGRLFGRLFF